jgi:hypothetical protein
MSNAGGRPEGALDDPILGYLLRGEASSLYEAEDMYLNASLPRILELVGSPISNEELMRHPLLELLLAHSSAEREDSMVVILEERASTRRAVYSQEGCVTGTDTGSEGCRR